MYTPIATPNRGMVPRELLRSSRLPLPNLCLFSFFLLEAIYYFLFSFLWRSAGPFPSELFLTLSTYTECTYRDGCFYPWVLCFIPERIHLFGKLTGVTLEHGKGMGAASEVAGGGFEEMLRGQALRLL